MERSKFVACTDSKWDVHSFSFTSEHKSFRVLAESDRGAVIIEFGTYILGCLFDIDKKYVETLVPLKNFIKTTTSKIYEGIKIAAVHQPIAKHIEQSKVMRREININVLIQPPSPRAKKETETEFKHSGFAIKRKDG